MHKATWMTGWVATVALVVLAGCEQTVSSEGRKLLEAGYAAYNRGDDKTAVEKTDAFLSEHEGSDRMDEAYLVRGLSRYRLGNYDGARADLDAVLATTRRARLKAQAALILGEMAYVRGRWPRAERMLELSLENTPRAAKPSDRAHFRLGVLLQRLGRWDEADRHFHHVSFLFPGSPLARRAEDLAGADAWTVQVGSFRQARNAEALERKLRAAGLDARALAVLAGKDLRYVVHVGRYNTYAAAAATVDDVRKHVPDAFVTTLK